MSKFEVISGVEGCCLALDDTRIAGPKPWGGGKVIHSWETDEEYKAVDAHTAELEAENAELRELVKDMFNCISYANEQDWFYFEHDKPGCGMSCVINGEGCGLLMLADRMHELGIEVDA